MNLLLARVKSSGPCGQSCERLENRRTKSGREERQGWTKDEDIRIEVNRCSVVVVWDLAELNYD